MGAALTEPARASSIPARWFPAIEAAVLLLAIAVGIGSYFLFDGSQAARGRLPSPSLMAVVLVANLIPAMALLVLMGRRIAKRRAARSEIGGTGTLHVRLVALFSILASVPMLLVTVVASFLFQYGVEFWSSTRARGIFENAQALAQSSYNEFLDGVDSQNIAVASDVRRMLLNNRYSMESDEFRLLYQQSMFIRSLSDSVVFDIPSDGRPRSLASASIYEGPLRWSIDPKSITALRSGRKSYVSVRDGQVQSVTRVPDTPYFVYSARDIDFAKLQDRLNRTRAILSDYDALINRSRSVQLRLNIALFIVSLLIVGLAVFVALAVADRLVRPVGALVGAARRIADGDLSARVPEPTHTRTKDEIGTLASAFNSMTERLQEQTGELVAANAQIDSRRALIEAVMSGVSAGVVSVGSDRIIRLANSSATALLKTGTTPLVGRPLADVAPELDPLLGSDTQDAIIQLAAGGEAKTLAVRITRDDGQHILTFDDITQQLLDQRRAAWSDVARRIAHEIKNPLTPIQLAAERLQRRYGSKLHEDDGTFARLTETIVRQVGDLRRMVDEFSSFARMPKPVFRHESLAELARQSLFLHEVAHPDIDFVLEAAGPAPLVCDRRQLGQALTNIVKNATEAVAARPETAERGRIEIDVRYDAQGRMHIDTSDNGIGLPVERDRIAEPYMTTRKGGTGLGLAIVRKIVEEHFGTISFADRPGGGTIVSIIFDPSVLAALAGTGSTEDDAPQEVMTRHPMLTRTGTPA
ncbi:PAS domain-containing sensor histidine kinase [Sphingomonas sp. Leaf24]|uniref:sensor histidine kinase NtrY-like n=1 Tax=unclassified Sphingomonas TaxID=196159 RepID=UPI0006F70CC3|nr:PAS domain-containing sensor histidine kinase [Sphingomonas sp. Leaf5]KQM89238.1 PAS domain-containing sensor histidine kinase [Sphingomonas sp. Leaf24]